MTAGVSGRPTRAQWGECAGCLVGVAVDTGEAAGAEVAIHLEVLSRAPVLLPGVAAAPSQTVMAQSSTWTRAA